MAAVFYSMAAVKTVLSLIKPKDQDSAKESQKTPIKVDKPSGASCPKTAESNRLDSPQDPSQSTAPIFGERVWGIIRYKILRILMYSEVSTQEAKLTELEQNIQGYYKLKIILKSLMEAGHYPESSQKLLTYLDNHLELILREGVAPILDRLEQRDIGQKSLNGMVLSIYETLENSPDPLVRNTKEQETIKNELRAMIDAVREEENTRKRNSLEEGQSSSQVVNDNQNRNGDPAVGKTHRRRMDTVERARREGYTFTSEQEGFIRTAIVSEPQPRFIPFMLGVDHQEQPIPGITPYEAQSRLDQLDRTLDLHEQSRELNQKLNKLGERIDQFPIGKLPQEKVRAVREVMTLRSELNRFVEYELCSYAPTPQSFQKMEEIRAKIEALEGKVSPELRSYEQQVKNLIVKNDQCCADQCNAVKGVAFKGETPTKENDQKFELAFKQAKKAALIKIAKEEMRLGKPLSLERKIEILFQELEQQLKQFFPDHQFTQKQKDLIMKKWINSFQDEDAIHSEYQKILGQFYKTAFEIIFEHVCQLYTFFDLLIDEMNRAEETRVERQKEEVEYYAQVRRDDNRRDENDRDDQRVVSEGRNRKEENNQIHVARTDKDIVRIREEFKEQDIAARRIEHQRVKDQGIRDDEEHGTDALLFDLQRYT